MDHRAASREIARLDPEFRAEELELTAAILRRQIAEVIREDPVGCSLAADIAAARHLQGRVHKRPG